MTFEREELVRHTWALLSDRLPALADAFYGRLFDIAPETRSLFHGTDMREQHRKFTTMLAGIVARLDLPEQLVPEVAALGRRHAAYGVADRDYTLVGDALVWALEHELGEAMTPLARLAWLEAYLIMASLMRRGAHAAAGG